MPDTPAWLTAEVLESLAPDALTNYRDTRYVGDDLGVSLADFVEPDRGDVQRLYAGLAALVALTEPGRAEVPAAVVCAFRDADPWAAVALAMRRFGGATLAARPGPRIMQIAHDVRGGALTPLLLRLARVGPGPLARDEAHQLYLLARDHLKILRNCVRDLDPAARERDRARRFHSVAHLLEKWRAPRAGAGLHARVTVDCRHDGNLAECCLEFSTLDRVLYNLLNNAARHAPDGAAHVVVLGTPPVGPQNVRFVVANTIAPAHRDALAARFADGLSDLFYGGFTTGGTGVGMRVCAELVANAYGVRSVERCLREGYVGARLVPDGGFVAWAHWPAAAD